LDELEINKTINEIRKLLDINHVSELLDELDKMLIEMNITQYVYFIKSFPPRPLLLLQTSSSAFDKILV
jgi:hypothetical protein